MPISFLFFLIFRNSIARIPYRLSVLLLGSMHPEDAWRDRFCVSVPPERVWRKSLFRVISSAFIILVSAACQKNRVSNVWNRLALGSSPGSRSATEGPSGHPAAILLAKHPEKWCGLIEASAIDMLGCCMAGLVSRQLMKATYSGCMGGRSGSAVPSCFLLHPLRQRLSDDQH